MQFSELQRRWEENSFGSIKTVIKKKCLQIFAGTE